MFETFSMRVNLITDDKRCNTHNLNNLTKSKIIEVGVLHPNRTQGQCDTQYLKNITFFGLFLIKMKW